MRKAHILNQILSETDRLAIRSLLARLGYQPEFAYPNRLSDLNTDIDVGVVCLPIDPSENAAVDQKVKDFTEASIRVVAIWLHEGDIPDAIRKFGFSAVAIGSAKIKEVLDGEEVIWEESSGAQRSQQKISRNKC